MPRRFSCPPLALLVAMLLATACATPSHDGTGGDPTLIVDAWAAGRFAPGGALLRLGTDQASPSRNQDEAAPPLPLASLGEGWSFAEPWGRWAIGRRSTLRLYLPETYDATFLLVGYAAPSPGDQTQGATVTINGAPAGTVTIEGTPTRFVRLDVERSLLRRGVNRLQLDWHYAVAPTNDDDRPLAVSVQRIGLLPRGATAPSATDQEPFRLSTEGDTLFLLGDGSYLAPLDVPADADALTFAVRGKHATFTAGALTIDGEAHHAAPVEGADDRFRLPLEALRGRRTMLFFQATFTNGASRLAIHTPRLTRIPGSGARPTAPATPIADGERAPDIVLAILDAARAKSVSAYGYERPTTPNLDRLAQDAWVFEWAFADCPYTICASPSLLAGIPFPRHGVVTRGLELAADVDTLAERLQRAGYRTIAYSANPNNGRLAGTHQGFDELYEVWHDKSRDNKRADPHPRRLTDLARARIAQGLGDEPVFLVLHYVPPHAPYAPDPEHDLFGDPSYDGPITNDPSLSRSLYQGPLDLPAADRDELEALYDGNLHMADAYLAKVFDALDEAGRFDDAWVVVTSDHGEAFLEHGVVGHNTTLFDEMLRVPLVVRPPIGTERAPVRLDRLARLHDLAPTLLARLGLPSEGMTGEDLLVESPSDRIQPLRTADIESTITGLRTDHHKLMVAPGPDYALYDLTTDPDESRNLARDQPLFTNALDLWRSLDLKVPSAAVANDEKLSDEARKTLEALGYL